MNIKGGRNLHEQTGRQAKQPRFLILLAVLIIAGLATSQALAAQVSLPAGARLLAVPVVVDDSYTVEMNTILDVTAPGVLGNDSDSDLHAFTAQMGAVNVTDGTLNLNADGSFDYTPDTDFWGTDTFSYTATDGTATSLEAAVTITVYTVPVITGDNGVAVNEDADVTITLDDLIVTDPDNTYPDDFTLTVQTGANYSVTNDTVTPDADFHGDLTVPVLVNDGLHDSNTYDLTVTVNPLNDAPAGADKTVTTAEDTARAFTAADFGFTDPKDSIAPDVLDAVVVTTLPGAGNLKLNNVNVNTSQAISAADITAGNFTFLPAAHGNGTPYTTFTFQVRDDGNTGAGHQNTDQSPNTITINVTAVPDNPVAGPDEVTTDEDVTWQGTRAALLANDSDPDGTTPTWVDVVNGTETNGTANTPGAQVHFVPTANFHGTGSFQYTITDGALQATGTVTVTINSINDAPAGANKTVTTAEETTYTFAAADFGFTDPNDAIAPNTLAGVRISTLPAAGNLQLDGVNVAQGNTVLKADIDSGKLKFVPAANGSGTGYASFTFQVQDNGASGGSHVNIDGTPNTITINVTPTNDVPIAVDDTAAVDEDSLNNNILVLTNDTDADLDLLTITGVTQGTLGTVSHTATYVTYTPTANLHGADSFTYTISDGQGGSDTATVNVTINSLNDAPAGTDNAVSTNEDISYTFAAVDFGFTDPNDATAPDSLAGVRISTLPLVGNLQLNSVNISAGTVITAAAITAGNFKYVPVANTSGATYASFNFQVQDSGASGAGNVNLDPSANTMTINVTAVNDPPVGDDNTVTTLEDTPYAFTTSDFPFTDPNDTPPNVLQSVTITGTAGLGALTLNGSPVVLPQIVTVAELNAGDLVFTPAANANGLGYGSFTFQVQDDGGGANIDPTARTMTINVTAVNDPPAGTNTTVFSLEDGTKVFAAVDFGFTDPLDTPANALQSVIIVNKTGGGTLALNGITVTNGQEILASAIGAGQLVFTPAPGVNGTGYASFTFQVRDNGGTNNGGINLDPTTNTMTIDVTPVNDPPVGTNNAVGTLEDTSFTFAAGNFPFSDAADSPVNTFLAVKITTLPTLGTLTLNNIAVTAGQVVSVADITGGLLKFAPAADANGTPYTTFTFQVQDNGGAVNGGIDLDPTPRTMTINVTAVNDAPEGTDKTLTTLEDTAITLVEADFGYTDVKDVPPNPFAQVKITSLPALGTLTWNNIPVAVDDFVTKAALASGFLKYTPPLNANGLALTSFTFVVFDAAPLGDSTPNTITFNVTAVNDVPVANAQSTSTNEDTAKAITLTGSDVETAPGALVYSIVTAPAHGQLTGTPPNVTYTPSTNFNGSDSFTFRIYDGTVFSPAAVVSITVNPVADDPVGAAETYYINAKTADPLVVSAADGVLINDSDPDGNTLTAQKLSDPSKGTLIFNADGSFSYDRTTAETKYTDTFTYRVADGTGRFSGTITVTIEVDLVPPPMAAWVLPVAQYDGVYSGPDETLELRVSQDSVADVNRVEFWWYDHINQQKYIFIASDATAALSGGKYLYSVMFDSSVLPVADDIQVWVRTFDTAGNMTDRNTSVNPPVYARLLFNHTGNAQIFLPMVVK